MDGKFPLRSFHSRLNDAGGPFAGGCLLEVDAALPDELIGPFQHRQARIRLQDVIAARIAGLEVGTTMLADDRFAKVFHAHLQIATTSRAFLHEIS